MKTDAVGFRLAKQADLPAIVRMLADDELGSQRERYEEPLPESYTVAFDQIERDSNNELIVAELNGEVIGTLHLMFLPSLSFQGGLRAQIESVRVDKLYQGQGIGKMLLRHTLEEAQKAGCKDAWVLTERGNDAAMALYKSIGGIEEVPDPTMFTFKL